MNSAGLFNRGVQTFRLCIKNSSDNQFSFEIKKQFSLNSNPNFSSREKLFSPGNFSVTSFLNRCNHSRLLQNLRSRCNEKLSVLGEIFMQQFNFYASQRLRRASQIWHLYKRLYTEKSIKHIVSQFARSLPGRRSQQFTFLLGAALFSWEKEKITDDEIERVPKSGTSWCFSSSLPTVKNIPRKKKCSSEKNKQRFNFINIQMLSADLHRQIFGPDSVIEADNNEYKKVVDHLKIHEIWGSETSILPEVDLTLPQMKGADIDEHFHILGEEISGNYKELVSRLSTCKLPPIPKEWKFLEGWVRYDSEGNSCPVSFPEEPALVFDVEVCVREGNYPTLATAVSDNYWYLWCSKRLVEDQFTWSDGISLSDLIPFETREDEVKPSDNMQARLLIGHNVAFDRAFVKEQYLLQGTKLYFLDTMSLHMCVSGQTGVQRAMSIASKKDGNRLENGELGVPFGWSDKSSLNNLADVYSLYCNGAILEKADREVFVNGTMDEIREKFQQLALYCAKDVLATHQILRKIIPMYFERFPHPVTFAGLLEMSTVYLPTNQNWERYLRDAEDTYSDLQKELKLSLKHLANDACSLLHGDMYKRDPWLWDLDWSVQEVKFKKQPVSQQKKMTRKSKNETTDTDFTLNESSHQQHVESASLLENHVIKSGGQTMSSIYKTATTLRKVQPFLPGYPAWYRDLCDKANVGKPDWEPGPSLISTQMRCVPKLMRLTWDGFPLHYDVKHGWGYLVPKTMEYEIFESSHFPLESFLKICSRGERSFGTESGNSEPDWSVLKEPKESSKEQSKLWQSVLHGPMKNDHPDQGYGEGNDHYGIGPYDIGIPGCSFYRLPHKDGPHKRVGNPLSKDFLPKLEDKTLRSEGKGQADRALVLSKMLSYWKNSHQRIVSQMVVQLNKRELPPEVTSHPDFDESNRYGAILPRLIPAGTVTRRAVEPTWLTASNAYSDRVGSELKSMVQAPPGYHFVGADVDSQELWIAAVLGDSEFAGIHGCTAFGWMTLQGKKSAETDMHSRTAKSVGVSRNQAKVLNYARIYGAGKAFTQRLLMQFNHRLSPAEAKQKVKKIYSETKGTRKLVLEEQNLEDSFHFGKMSAQKKIWVGGSESHLFNKLEEIAVSSKPQTPVLKCRISRALEPKAVDTNFMTSRINWVVQSSAVDYLHLMLVSMKWLFKHYGIDGRLSICIHDEVRFLVKSDDRYRAALALQITNLWTRCLFAYKLGMKDLPQSVAFFSSVDIDSVLRKEVTMDAVTPSNPHGLEKGYGIPPGEALDIYQVLEKTKNGCLEKNSES